MWRGKGGDVSAEPARGGGGGLRPRAWGKSLACTRRMKDMDVTGCQGGHKVGCTSRGEGGDPPALAGL